MLEYFAGVKSQGLAAQSVISLGSGDALGQRQQVFAQQVDATAEEGLRAKL